MDIGSLQKDLTQRWLHSPFCGEAHVKKNQSRTVTTSEGIQARQGLYQLTELRHRAENHSAAL